MLLGAGPGASQPQYPVIPPSIGYVSGLSEHALTHDFISASFSLLEWPFTGAPLYIIQSECFSVISCDHCVNCVWHFQDEDRYPQKPPSLLGGGPGAPAQQWPIHPPGFGYLWLNCRQPIYGVVNFLVCS